MKILGYDEVDEQQVLELNLRCFRWFLSPKQVKIIRRVDKRVPDYFALYAVEKEHVLCQVGVVTMDTQTTHGKEKVGFIWGVCTRPNAARKGLARKLIKEAHARLIDEGIRYSFLGTGKSLVAYNLYKELGYNDFLNLSCGLKMCKQKSFSDMNLVYTSKAKNDTIVDLFTEYSKGLLGFVHRPKNFVEVRKAWSWMSINKVGMFWEEDRPIGYLMANMEGKIIKINELCCPKREDLSRCIDSMETKFKPNYILLEWTAGFTIAKAFAQVGFKHIIDSWEVFMVKDLKGEHPMEQIQESYGINDDKLHMTNIDEY